MLKAVLFDLDGVITDTAKFHFLAWRDLGAELGITVDEAFNEELKGVSRMDSLERILAYGGLADKYSLAEKEAFCTKKNDHYLELIQEMTPADILPGILPLLEELREAGLKTIITSASKNAPGILDVAAGEGLLRRHRRSGISGSRQTGSGHLLGRRGACRRATSRVHRCGRCRFRRGCHQSREYHRGRNR